MDDVTIVGGGPTGLMLAAELALLGVAVTILERRPTPELVGSRARGFHSRTIEILDQRGVVDRFLAEGQTAQALSFGGTPLDVGSLPSRHPYTLGLGQSHIERILLGWVEELGVPVRRGGEVTGFAQDDAGVDVHLAGGEPLRTSYLVGTDGGRSVIRTAAGIDLVGAEATRSHLVAEVEMTDETPTGIRLDDLGVHAMNVMEDGRTVGVVVTEQQLGPATEPTLKDLSKALKAVYGRDFGEGDFRCLHPRARGALVVGTPCTAHLTPPGHQDPGELLPPYLRDVRVAGSPSATVDDEVPTVRRDLRRLTHPVSPGRRGQVNR